MPITKDVSNKIIYTAKKSLNTTAGEDTGVVRDADFAVCDSSDFTKQLKTDLSGAESGAVITLKAADSSSGAVELTMPSSSGSLAVVTSIEIPVVLVTGVDPGTPVPLDMPATMRLRKVGDVVFCSLDEIAITSFPGVTDSDIHMAAGTIPEAYRPPSDVVSAPISFFSPAITGVASPDTLGRIIIMKNIQGDGFTNGDPINIAYSSFFWCTNALDA